MSNSDITYYLCGGTGINIGLALKAAARTPQNKEATLVGLDSSGANSSNEQFTIERMIEAGSSDKQTRGSGKMRAANYEQAQPFVKSVLTKHKPSSYNVVVCNTAGGTGSMLAVLVVRALLQANLPTALCLISDHTSTIEMENDVKTKRSIANQVKVDLLNLPVCYIDNINTADKNRGQVNADVVNRLDLLSFFFTELNGEMDYADIRNCLMYSKASNVPPAFSRISFYDQDSAKEYDGKTPVAVASLFESSDEVIPLFEGTTYRTTGVFPDNVSKPNKLTQLHMVLDHGEAIQDLEASVQKLEDHRTEVATNYVKQKDLGGNSDNNGMDL